MRQINTNPTTKEEATRMAKVSRRWQAITYTDYSLSKIKSRGTRFSPEECAALEEMLQRYGWRRAPGAGLSREVCWEGGFGRLDDAPWSLQRACAQLFDAIARSM
jgi:hypothetical protein